ncbi:MAG: hypothetical protein ACKVU2_08405 [Saprospiraceae bacterium]
MEGRFAGRNIGGKLVLGEGVLARVNLQRVNVKKSDNERFSNNFEYFFIKLPIYISKISKTNLCLAVCRPFVVEHENSTQSGLAAYL